MIPAYSINFCLIKLKYNFYITSISNRLAYDSFNDKFIAISNNP